jgi:hypothetical protein
MSTIALHVFTEEASAKKVFEVLLPKILPEGIDFRVHSHQGKKDLENALRTTVPTISKIPGSRILITQDQDCGDCEEVKKSLLNLVEKHCKSRFLIRIVCRELESWFLGDLNAIAQAYPRFKPDQYQKKAKFREVDSILSPNKVLLSIIPEYKNKEVLPKLETSKKIAPFLNLRNNASVSFNQTLSGVERLIND